MFPCQCCDGQNGVENEFDICDECNCTALNDAPDDYYFDRFPERLLDFINEGGVIPDGDVDHEDEDRRAYQEELIALSKQRF